MPTLRRAGSVLAVLALLARSGAALAASRPDAEQKKIDWLLATVEGSQGKFIRNGSEYGASKAASHLRRKLFFAGKRVQTAEDFIGGVATRSEESSRPYEIRLPDGKQMNLADWLIERLLDYGKEPGTAPPKGSR